MRLIPEDLLRTLMGRPGEIPAPGNDRWGKSVQLVPGASSYTVINTGMLGDVPTAIAFQLAFSLDDVTYTPFVPIAYAGAIVVDFLKAVDVKAGGFREQVILNAGDAMPFCTLLARALTVSVEIANEAAGPIFIHAVAAPVQTIDCGSITVVPPPPAPELTPWTDVGSLLVAADTVGSFLVFPASSTTKQIFIQNNSAVDLLIGFGSFIPALGPPPLYNILLPGGIHAIFESQFDSFKGAVHAIFDTGGSASDYASFTRGII